MPLPLPDLDTRRYDDLVAELQALIPQLAPHWTNRNASDPGVTLIELLAWMTEASLYRLNQIPEQTYWNLITLLRGIDQNDEKDAEWQTLSKIPLSEAKALSLAWYNERYRAVTAADFEELVLEHEFPAELGLMPIARAKATSHFEHGTVTVIIVPEDPQFFDESIDEAKKVQLQESFEKTKQAVKEFLDQRRLVGTRVRIRGPIFTEVSISIELDIVADAELTTVQPLIQDSITQQITAYVDPLTGGPDANGWPFGRPLSVHDIRPLVESVNDVGRVTSLVLDGEPSRIEAVVVDLPKISAPNPIIIISPSPE